MAMEFLSKRIWVSLLIIPFMIASCEGFDGLGGGSGSGTTTEKEIIITSGATLVEGYDCVDLGLSVKWAAYNIGGYSEKDRGDYYSWGETEPKSDYSENTYRYLVVTPEQWFFTKYCPDSIHGYEYYHDTYLSLVPTDDVAHVKWGGEWRMPSMEELQELVDNCDFEWCSVKNSIGKTVTGYKATSKKAGYTDRSIFLPASGYREGKDTKGSSHIGCYWSNELYLDNTGTPLYGYYLILQEELYYGSKKVYTFAEDRMRGLNVRAVHP